MIVPVVVYDWANAAHSTLEIMIGATAWPFGLNHFVQNGDGSWPIVIGPVPCIVSFSAAGVVFGGLADRFLQLRSLPEALVAGLAWGFASRLMFWYTLLPIARGWRPFHATAVSTLFVAPIWASVLALALLGPATSRCYLFLGRA